MTLLVWIVIYVLLRVKQQHWNVCKQRYFEKEKVLLSRWLRPTAVSLTINVLWECRVWFPFCLKAIHVYILYLGAKCTHLQAFMSIYSILNAPTCIIHAKHDGLHVWKDQGQVVKQNKKLNCNRICRTMELLYFTYPYSTSYTCTI